MNNRTANHRCEIAALVKFGHMLERLRIPGYEESTLTPSDNLLGADHQQERLQGLLEVSSETLRQTSRNGFVKKIKSELHSDMQRSTEMIDPPKVN